MHKYFKKNVPAIIFISLLILFFSSFSAFAEEAMLRIDTGGHTGLIRKLLLTSDKKFIVTCSDDKTIKVFDVKTKIMVRKILGNIGEDFGEIYAIALSPDDKYLAAGGYLNSDPDQKSVIRYYDFASGRLIKILKGHKKTVLDLSFSNDGKYLASSSYDNSVIIWDTASLSIFHQITEFKKEINAVKIYKYADEYRIAMACEEGYVKLYSVTYKKMIKSESHSGNASIKSIDILLPDPVRDNYPQGLLVSLGSDGIIQYYNLDLKFINKTEPNKFNYTLHGVKISNDAKLLLVGSGSSAESDIGIPQSCFVYDIIERKIISEFREHKNTVLSLNFLPDNTAVTGGVYEIFFWNPVVENSSGPIQKNILGKIQAETKTIWSLGIKDGTIAFGYKPRNLKYDPPEFTKVISLDNLNISDFDNYIIKKYNTVNSKYQDYKIRTKKGGNLYYDNAVLVISKGDKEIASITRDSTDGLNHNSVTFTGEGYIISSGSYGTLTAYDLEGRKVADFIGHYNEVLAIATENNLLVSCGGDQTVRIWDLNELKKGAKKIYPVVSMLITENSDYLLWTNDNYFTGIKRLYKYIGWHMNQGTDKEAKYYPFDQFELKYNRPDIILQKLGMTDKDVIASYYNLYLNRIKKMGFTEEQMSGALNMPEIKLNTDAPKGITGQDYVNLKIQAKDSKYILNKVNVFLNDVPVYGINGISIKDKNLKEYGSDIKINLCYGANKVQVSVINDAGVESLKETVYIQCTKPFVKPDLFIATAGISRYKDSAYNLTYADKDAEDIIQMLNLNKDLYKEIKILKLNNEQGTKENILKIQNFFNQSKADDYAVLFIAGHGLRDEKNDYYFATHDIDFNNPSKNGMNFSELDMLLDGIPAIKKLLIMDTCFSGEAAENEKAAITEIKDGSVNRGIIKSRDASRGLKTVTPAKKEDLLLFQKDFFSTLRIGTGAIVIASSSAMEYSYESGTIKNGIFTYSLINGCSDKKADINGDKKIQVSEIVNYTYKTVTELTSGRQTPTMRRENLEFDYVLY